jgi:hypothetical protein
MTISIVAPQRRYTTEGKEVVNVKRVFFLAVALLLLAHQTYAVYVIMLRSGNRIVAKEKYTVKGPNAVFETKTGAFTSIPLSQIDLESTEKINSLNLGDVQTLDWVDIQKTTPTPTPTVPVSSLGRLRTDLAKPEAEAAKPTPTPGVIYRDKRYHDPQVDQAFQQGLESYHLYLYRTSQGTQPTYLFIELQVNGQPETLKALQAVTQTYQLLADKAPNRVPERVELQMLNESGKEAGVFRISAADAAALVSGKITAENFFIQHVIF